MSNMWSRKCQYILYKKTYERVSPTFIVFTQNLFTYLQMDEVKHEDCEVKPDIFSNPWLVQSYDEFLYYCCPECNYKCQQHEEFSSHAVLLHPLVCQLFLCTYGLHPFSFDIF